MTASASDDFRARHLRLVPDPALVPQRAVCLCGCLPHRSWCPAKDAYDRGYQGHVERAERSTR